MDGSPRRNLEIKARAADLEKVRAGALQLGAIEHETLEQIDTYFDASVGRLKLREIVGRGAQLIGYERPDSVGTRVSDFRLVEVMNAAELRDLLTVALGVRGQVSKRRQVLRWQDVRIHLDQVEGLGQFIELEAVVSIDSPEAICAERIRFLRSELEIADADLIGVSYSDLLGL